MKGLQSSGDLAKNIFQVHGVGGDGARRQIRQRPDADVFLVTGAVPCRYWARELMALGYEV
jgi:hypothetical protein